MKITEKRKYFEEQYNELFPYIYKYVTYRIESIHDAEDLVSHIFLVAYEKIHQYNPKKGSLRQWITGVMKYTLFNYWRDKKIVVNLEEIDEYTFEQYKKNNNSIDSKIFWENISTVLPKNHFTILLLHYVDGFTHKEIAKITKKNHAAIRKTFSRIHMYLGKELMEYKKDFV